MSFEIFQETTVKDPGFRFRKSAMPKKPYLGDKHDNMVIPG